MTWDVFDVGSGYNGIVACYLPRADRDLLALVRVVVVLFAIASAASRGSTTQVTGRS